MKDSSRTTVLHFALAAACVLSLACSGDPAGPRARTSSPPRFTALDSSTKTLYVAVNGPNRVTAEGWYTYKAFVQGTNSTKHYNWLQQYCYNDFAYCSTWALISSHVGVDSIRIEYPGNIGKMRIAVEVWDEQTAPWSGSNNMVTIGPAPVNYTNPTFGCQYQDTLYYPIQDFDGRYFRRDACTGTRVFKP